MHSACSIVARGDIRGIRKEGGECLVQMHLVPNEASKFSLQPAMRRRKTSVSIVQDRLRVMKCGEVGLACRDMCDIEASDRPRICRVSSRDNQLVHCFGGQMRMPSRRMSSIKIVRASYC